MSSVREATHAGSWYTSNRSSLEAELSKNLAKVTPLPKLDFSPPAADAKAIIAPHAGYAYSGGAAAWAYAAVPTDKIKRVFLLGPSHHKYIDGIALSPFSSYDTPLGEIPLCVDTLEELEATGAFRQIRPGVDEDEHSLEMHLPYIRHIFKGREDLMLVPLIVGSARSGTKISSILEKYWKDPATFFIISSDFCHWGTRFSCTPYYHNAPHPPIPVPPLPHPTLPASFEPPEFAKEYSRSKHTGGVPIWQSIQYLDHQGIDLLRQPAGEGAVEKWEAYLDRTKNTICGRNPITVLLHLIQHVYAGKEGAPPEFTFVRYEQSSKCEKASDSSVSYVSGVLRVPS